MTNRQQRRHPSTGTYHLPSAKPGAGLVLSGFCYGQQSQTPQWRVAYTQVLMLDGGMHQRIIGECGHEASGAHVPDARCNIVRQFLDNPLQPEWLWLHDTDATFAPDTLERLITAADPDQRPIMGALAFGVRVTKDEHGRSQYSEVMAPRLELYPMIYLLDNEHRHCLWETYPRNQIIPVVGTACHCLLIHRRVLADPKWQEDGHPQPWFRMSVYHGEVMSEDHFFCMKAQALGYPVHVHTGIKTGHVKTFVADEDAYMAQQTARGISWPISDTLTPR